MLERKVSGTMRTSEGVLDLDWRVRDPSSEEQDSVFHLMAGALQKSALTGREWHEQRLRDVYCEDLTFQCSSLCSRWPFS